MNIKTYIQGLVQIYNLGKPGISLLEDGWTIATKDGTLAGLFERTIAITKKGPVVLTAE